MSLTVDVNLKLFFHVFSILPRLWQFLYSLLLCAIYTDFDFGVGSKGQQKGGA